MTDWSMPLKAALSQQAMHDQYFHETQYRMPESLGHSSDDVEAEMLP